MLWGTRRLWVLGQRFVDEVTEVRLETNMQEAKNGEYLVYHGIANRGIQTNGKIEVLDRLQKFH